MDQFTESKLKEWGFEQYVVRFKEAEIDCTAFLTLTENMVAELILIIGHRSKFVNYLKQLNEKHNKEESLPLLRQSVMLKENVLDEVLPPQLNAQTTVILNDREKATDQCRKRSSIAVKCELSDDSHNIATTSSTADQNSGITLSDNSSSQSKRQRISSNLSSSKHEDDSTSYGRTDEVEVPNNWKRCFKTKIFVEPNVDPYIMVWAGAATRSAEDPDSHNRLYRENLQEHYETINIPNHSTFCRNQILKNVKTPSYGANDVKNSKQSIGMINLYQEVHKFELKHNCKFTFLRSFIGKNLKKCSKKQDLALDPVHLVSNNVTDVMHYPLRYGFIPNIHMDLQIFLESIFLNNGFDSESTRRIETEDGNDTVVQFNLIEGEIEALFFDYWSRYTVDLIKYDESKSRPELKSILRYLFQELCDLYCGVRTPIVEVGLFLTNFRKFAEFDLNDDIIPTNCLIFLKLYIDSIWSRISPSEQTLWCALFNEMKVHHFRMTHTISAMFKSLDRRFEFIISKAEQINAFRSIMYCNDGPLIPVRYNLCFKESVRKEDVIHLLPKFFRSSIDVKNPLCTAIDNFYYYHIFLLSRYTILHNIDVATRVLTSTAVQGFLDEHRVLPTPDNCQKPYVKLHVSEQLQSMMVSYFRLLYIRDSDKFEADVEIAEFDPTLYQSLNELICDRMNSALYPILDREGNFSPERFCLLHPKPNIVVHDRPPSSNHLCCYAFASSLYAHMYGLTRRESVSICAELNCNFERVDKFYYENIIADSDNVIQNKSSQIK